MIGKTVSSTRVEMAEVMQPNDANFHGKVFGGRILALLDLVAYVATSRYAGHLSVTASFDRVDFHEPIEVGELVTFIGHITYVGRTSMEVTIEVYAENVLKGDKRHTNTARVTFVAVGENGRPVLVPPLVCETREEKIRFLEGRLRRELRGRQKSDFSNLAIRFGTSDDAELDRLIASEKLLED
jgi:acyl-CoA hydrolase